MDIRGLLLVNGETIGTPDQAPASALMGAMDVAGKSALERMAERMRQFGIASISTVVETGPSFVVRDGVVRDGHARDTNFITATPERFWRVAEAAFNEMAQGGAELVVLVRLGAYTEPDFERLVQFHLDRGARVTQMSLGPERLEIFCISASRRNDAASLFRTQLARCRSDCPLLLHDGYFNSLAGPRELRQFAIDILTRKTQTAPAGDEARPGVWIASGALVEKGARILAPAFVGARARLRSGAVITRCSSIERHAEVDCGTIVENSTVLPFSYVGAGLDLGHSVAGMGRVANLRRDVDVAIPDPKLMDLMPATSGKRFLAAAAEMLTYLPRLVWQSAFTKAKTPEPALQATLRQVSPIAGEADDFETTPRKPEAAQEFPNMVVARRYGHQ
jgi:hypothetical protein